MQTVRNCIFLWSMLILACTRLQAQTTAYSPVFYVNIEVDEEAPSIAIEHNEANNQIVLNFADDSGIDTVWIDEEAIPGRADTLLSIEREAFYNKEYLVKATDIKGSKVEQTFRVDWDGNLKRGARISQSASEKYTIHNATYHALLVGVENYQDARIPDLSRPVDDAEALYAILTENYAFEPQNVKILKDPTEDAIESALDVLKDKMRENDNLLLFFAGHGHWVEQSGTGFWFPSDAKKGEYSTYVRNSTIRDYIKEINAHHTLLITDACFGGSIFNTRNVGNEEEMSLDRANKLYRQKSRKAMTSGTLDLVPDKSVFMRYLLKQLRENRESYLSAGNLFYRFNKAVINNSENVPQYEVIVNSGDEGGEFIFIKR